jgi:hypothetical protein
MLGETASHGAAEIRNRSGASRQESGLFEYEIGRGQQEVKFVNGTCATFQRCCEPDTCVTVSARHGIRAFVLFNWIAPWHSAPDHALNIQRWAAEPEPASFDGAATSKECAPRSK